MTELRVGDRFRWRGVLGKIVLINGGLIYFCTPGGTVINMGLCHADFDPLTPADDAKLRAYEVDSLRTRQAVYADEWAGLEAARAE